MPLAAGKTLSHYEILGPLGAGGMGEVYRAKDTRLGREVAVKVLPEHFADSDERLRRFEREARTLASLNHPNVAGIHGVDQEGGLYFLALELVPGEDLATRLARGPLPLDEALEVCRQIAEGLEAAHEAGVVHRDLKPANVRVTPEGVVKILDFGLAKPIRPTTDAQGTSTAESDSFLMTEEGLLLGTPTYMSPEQARGKPVDRRTDVWAFGCVLFECLTGERPFGGESIPDLLAAIVGEEPDWSLLPGLPPRVEELLRRTLVKDPRARLRDIGEARIALEAASGRAVGGAAGPAAAPLHGAGGGGRTRWLELTKFAVGCVIVSTVFTLVRDLVRGADPADGTPSAASAVKRPSPALDVVLAEFTQEDRVHEVRLSPDGTHVAWLAAQGLFVRALADRDAVQIEGVSADAARMFDWSLDSQRLAYVGKEGVWTVTREGDERRKVFDSSEVDLNGGVRWQEDGLVLGLDRRIVRLAVEGGEPETLHEYEAQGLLHLDGILPLPGDRGFLYVPHFILSTPNALAWSGEESGRNLLSLESTSLSDLFLVGDSLLFRAEGEEGGIYRSRLSFDPVELGRPVRLPIEGEEPSVSEDGTIAFLEGDAAGKASLGWFSLAGTVERFGRSHPSIADCALSPDGEGVAYAVLSKGQCEVWMYEVERDLATQRLEVQTPFAVLSFLEDGRVVVSTFEESRAYNASGLGESERLAEGVLLPFGDVSRYRITGLATGTRPEFFYEDLSAPSSQPQPLFDPSSEAFLMNLSADGEWMLYSTDRTGERELRFAAFPPDPRRDWAVTAEGGDGGWFDEEGRRILFEREDEDGRRALWAVTYELTPEVRLGRPEQVTVIPAGVRLRHYDPEGDRLLAVVQDAHEKLTLRLVTNWGAGEATER